MNIKKSLLAVSVAASLVSANAMAYQAGDIIGRIGAAGVYPTGESEDLNAIPGGNVEADSAWSLGINLTYMINDNLGIGVLGSWPFEHDVNGKGNSPDETLATTKHLPPTITAQWHFPTAGNLHPFVGVGFNYTYFFDEDTDGAISDADIDIDNSFGPALEAGLDVELDNGLMVGAQIWYIGIEPEAKITGGALNLNEKIDVEIDPLVFMLSVGKKF